MWTTPTKVSNRIPDRCPVYYKEGTNELVALYVVREQEVRRCYLVSILVYERQLSISALQRVTTLAQFPPGLLPLIADYFVGFHTSMRSVACPPSGVTSFEGGWLVCGRRLLQLEISAFRAVECVLPAHLLSVRPWGEPNGPRMCEVHPTMTQKGSQGLLFEVSREGSRRFSVSAAVHQPPHQLSVKDGRIEVAFASQEELYVMIPLPTDGLGFGYWTMEHYRGTKGDRARIGTMQLDLPDGCKNYNAAWWLEALAIDPTARLGFAIARFQSLENNDCELVQFMLPPTSDHTTTMQITCSLSLHARYLVIYPAARMAFVQDTCCREGIQCYSYSAFPRVSLTETIRISASLCLLDASGVGSSPSQKKIRVE